ncbi:hypothetical protein [Roseibium alexandrii]|uniref:hypothetical protein n=2 Tax=Stappiaceae TaxID=2821832 RepID=UPI0016400F2A|nr:hypothetical protein [Roseibium alexandrii]
MTEPLLPLGPVTVWVRLHTPSAHDADPERTIEFPLGPVRVTSAVQVPLLQ